MRRTGEKQGTQSSPDRSRLLRVHDGVIGCRTSRVPAEPGSMRSGATGKDGDLQAVFSLVASDGSEGCHDRLDTSRIMASEPK
jgi:hypothetical protein